MDEHHGLLGLEFDTGCEILELQKQIRELQKAWITACSCYKEQ